MAIYQQEDRLLGTRQESVQKFRVHCSQSASCPMAPGRAAMAVIAYDTLVAKTDPGAGLLGHQED